MNGAAPSGFPVLPRGNAGFLHCDSDRHSSFQKLFKIAKGRLIK
jgi:hypothetical protein